MNKMISQLIYNFSLLYNGYCNNIIVIKIFCYYLASVISKLNHFFEFSNQFSQLIVSENEFPIFHENIVYQNVLTINYN